MTIRNAVIVGEGMLYRDYRDTKKRGDPTKRVGQSDLREIDACPRRWKMSDGLEKEPTEGMLWGTLVDALVLNPAKTRQIVAVSPQEYDDAKGERKPWNWNATVCKEWRNQNTKGGQIVASHTKWAQVQLAAQRLHDDAVVMDLLAVSTTQVAVNAEYVTKGGLIIPVGGLLDIVPRVKDAHYSKVLADLKTTDSADPDKWGRTVFSGGYHVQAAFYLDLYNAATGEGRNQFLHLVQERDAPYEVGRRVLAEEFIQIGRATYERAIEKYAECLTSTKWPGYDDAQDNQSLDGWTTTQAAPWMVMAAGVQLTGNADLI